jgi:hypothetical protein
VPAGQISKNTFDFLTQLKDPKCNDREWFVSSQFMFISRLLHHPQVQTKWYIPSVYWIAELISMVHLEPVYRLAEQEWKDFIEEFTTTLVDEVDSQIPHLPPKDCILRIYRDVRRIASN